MCSKSHGERSITKWLEDNTIEFIPQYRFDNCRDVEPLPFDFYLPEHNICIEYDGEQHFKPVNFGGVSDERAMINFNKTQEHDAIKNNYCKHNNIMLVRISYLDKNNIDDILADVIKNNIFDF